MVQWLRLSVLKAGGPGLIPGQGTRSHIPQLTFHIPQLKIPLVVRKIKKSRMPQLRPGAAKNEKNK